MGQKAVYVDTQLITELIRSGAITHCRVVEGLPWDAKLVRIIPDHSINFETPPPRLALVYESAEWPELPEGSVLPVQTIQFEAIRGNDE